MSTTPELTRINIRPGVSILSVLRYLNYKPWFAVAEFVDNSLQSFLDHKTGLASVEGKDFRLKVEVEFDATDGGRLVVRDNAAGIHQADYARAFRPAEIPPDRSGLAEFGMGMKSAACWFSPTWSVRTSALDEPVERTVAFDIDAIVKDSLDELEIRSRPVKAMSHYTEITLSQLHRPPQPRTIGKVREHLASIYRVFLRDGTMELKFNGDSLSFPEPKVLCKPFFKMPSGPAKIWRKEIEFDFGLGMRVHGFAALFETASIPNAGFALFRRNRLIQGGVDEGYRPEKIFGSSNKFTYQRLFGELHLEGFEVSHTKDGFRWEDNEDDFLDLLKEHLNAEPLPLLDQAEGHRVRVKPDDLKKGAEIATKRTAEVIERDIPPILEKQFAEELETAPPPKVLPKAADTISDREITVSFQGCEWHIRIELTCDPAIGDWLSFSDYQAALRQSNASTRRVEIRLSLVHPFMEQFSGKDSDEIEPLLRLAAAIALAELAARQVGEKGAGTVRRNINELLRDGLSKP